MDLKGYYRKIREVEASLEQKWVVVRSLSTEAGGKAGMLTEVDRGTCARMVVDGVAEFASDEEAAGYQRLREEAKAQEDKRRAAEQIHFRVMTEADFRSFAKPVRSGKKD